MSKNWQTWLRNVLAVLSLGMAGSLAYSELSSSCCAPGAACCAPGSPCCQAHKH